MDGMRDASGALQGDVVEKHGSFSVGSTQCSSGAAIGALSPAQSGVLNEMFQISGG